MSLKSTPFILLVAGVIFSIAILAYLYLGISAADTVYRAKPFTKGEEIVTKAETELINIIEENLDPKYKIMHAVKMNPTAKNGNSIYTEIKDRLEEVIQEIPGYYNSSNKTGNFYIVDIRVERVNLGQANCSSNGTCTQTPDQRPEIYAKIEIKYLPLNKATDRIVEGTTGETYILTADAKATHIKV